MNIILGIWIFLGFIGAISAMNYERKRIIIRRKITLGDIATNILSCIVLISLGAVSFIITIGMFFELCSDLNITLWRFK